MSAELIREYVRLVLERERRKKPGGPRSDVGALRQLNPDAFNTRVRSTVKSAEGDVGAAAKRLGVAKRTLYHYLDDEPSLSRVKTSSELHTDESPDAGKK